MRSCVTVPMAALFLGGLFAARLSAFVPPATRISDVPPSHSRTAFFFGVMGEVSHPGVYELPADHPKLTEIVARAGGLTADASRTIRVVREGRIAFQTYHTPRLTLTLLPGDLLLVDRGRADYRRGGDIHLAGQIGPRASQSRPDTESRIEVAFVGLIDRPVVLRLRETDATLGRVAELLKQSPEVIKTLRLIAPPRSRSQTKRARLTAESRLSSGSVVVFRRTHLEATRIPPLPKPISPDERSSAPSERRRRTAKGTHPRLGAGAPINRSGSRSLGNSPAADRGGVILASGAEAAKAGARADRKRKNVRIRKLLASARVDLEQRRYDAARRKALAAQRAGIPFSLHEDRPELILADIAKRTATSRARGTAARPGETPAPQDLPPRTIVPSGHHVSEDLSAKQSPKIHSGWTVPHRLSQLAPPKSAVLSNDEPHSAKPVLMPRAADSTSRGRSPEMAAEMAASGPPNQSAQGVLWLSVLGCGLLAVGLASAFLISMARTAVKSATAESERGKNDTPLEALIHNTLPVRSEAVELPVELSLHGRPTGPQKLRIDSGHAQLRGPHFGVTADHAPAASAGKPSPVGRRVDPAQSVTDDESIGRRREPLGPRKRGAVQRDLLDRVLSTVNKATDA